MMTNMQTKDIKKDSLKAWILASRPKTLSGAAVPVMIGLSLAYKDSAGYEGEPFSWVAAVLCLLFAWVMQIDANFINDFFDYANGTDNSETRLGPRRACAQGWVSVDKMKHAIALTTCAACLIGLPLVIFGGMEMLLIGILCVVFCFLYTTHLSYVGLGDVLVIVFFGIIPVCIPYYIQVHTCSAFVILVSLASGRVVDTLLIVNNFRDRDTDKEVGKTTLVVKIGEKASLQLYLALGWGACLMGAAYMTHGYFLAFVLPTMYLVFHQYTYMRIKRINRGKALNLCLGETARNIFIYGAMVTIGILLS